MTRPETLSFWHDSLDEDWTTRPALSGDRDADVAIVGAGYTGLWTAYYLSRADPSLRVVVLEREFAGFGASGRNGGWCSALYPVSVARLAEQHGEGSAVRQHRALQRTVDEVADVTAREGIDCHWAKGGTVVAARSPLQLERARSEVATARRWGFGEDDLALLGPAEAAERIGATSVLGATYSPHCAALHPARLVRGLARVVERRVTIHEETAVRRIEPGVVMMIATEPLSDQTWARLGLGQRETFADHRRLVIYGQRTADGRLAFGGRGAPYHWGSKVRPEYDRELDVFAGLRSVLVDLFPAVRSAAITHAWGGPLGVPRDWCPSVGLDRGTGLAWAGGYVGDGVATSNLAGRTLADLVLDRATELTDLPWVNHRSPRWEPEPLRWLGINGARIGVGSADPVEDRTNRPSLRGRVVDSLLPH
jgi:glycine/D-amino acid oxidase-like deaminating enzyme